MNRSTPDFSDPAQLVAAFRTGDRAAWDTLYDQTAPRLLAWARSLTGCASDAEDLAQETFVAAFAQSGGFRGKSSVLTWLCGIALRKWRDKRRSPRPETLPLCDEILPSPKFGLENDTQNANAVLLRLAYRQAVADLPENLRDAFVLVAQHGFTHKEAAQILSIPEGTAKWRVAQATRTLRLALADFAPSAPNSKEPSQ